MWIICLLIGCYFSQVNLKCSEPLIQLIDSGNDTLYLCKSDIIAVDKDYGVFELSQEGMAKMKVFEDEGNSENHLVKAFYINDQNTWNEIYLTGLRTSERKPPYHYFFLDRQLQIFREDSLIFYRGDFMEEIAQRYDIPMMALSKYSKNQNQATKDTLTKKDIFLKKANFILDNDYEAIYTTHNIPRGLRKTLKKIVESNNTSKIASPRFKIYNKDSKKQFADYPYRKLIFGVKNDKNWIICYKHNGRGTHYHMILVEWIGMENYNVYGAVLHGFIEKPSDLRILLDAEDYEITYGLDADYENSACEF